MISNNDNDHAKDRDNKCKDDHCDHDKDNDQ